MKHLSPMYPLGEETKKRNKGVQSVPLKNYFWYRKCTEGWGHSFLPPRLHLPDDLVNSYCSCFASPPLSIVTLPLMRIFPLQVSESVPEEVRKWLASTFAKQEQVHVGDGHGQVMMTIYMIMVMIRKRVGKRKSLIKVIVLIK